MLWRRERTFNSKTLTKMTDYGEEGRRVCTPYMDEQICLPYLPPLPAKMLRGKLDLKTESWVDTSLPDDELEDVNFQTLEDMTNVLVLQIDGDKLRETGDVEGGRIVAMRDLDKAPVGAYFAPYGRVCKKLAGLRSTLKWIIPEKLGDDWATLQVFQTFGRLHDKQSELSLYGFFLTIEWERFALESWKITARKAYVHR